MTAAEILFIAFGASATLAALALLAQTKNPVGAALAFGASMLSVSGALAVLGAHALAALLLWFEAGAVLAGISFGVHLQNLESPGFSPGHDRGFKLVAAIALVAGVFEAVRACLAAPELASLATAPAGLSELGRVLFSDALLITELIPLLLVSTGIGMLALLHREAD